MLSIIHRVTDIKAMTRKEIGALGERVAAEYLRRHGFTLADRNVARKTGEIDVIMQKGNTLHFVEVKTVLCSAFPKKGDPKDAYDPSANLHAAKIQKVARTSEWYAAEKGWQGNIQIDGALVWIRKSDGIAKVAYLQQIL